MEQTASENKDSAQTESGQKKNDTEKNFNIPLAIIVAGILIAGAVLYVGVGGGAGNNGDVASVGGAEKPVPHITVSEKDHMLGNPDAPVVLVEFSDLECPFCKVFHQTMKKVMETYGGGGEVAWVYKHFPIDSLHPKARKESAAAECAARLGGEVAFWEYTDKIFEITPSNNGLDPAQLPKIATDIGLDKAAFSSCLENSASNGIDEIVQGGVAEGLAAGVNGTPFTVIVTKDGSAPTPINGAQAFETVKAMIDAALQN